MAKPTILCIDDEKIVLDSVKAQLKNYLGRSYDIEIAESGSEALELVDDLVKLNGEPPHLVICDQIMPRMKGHEVLSSLYALYPNIYYILLTGQANKDDIVKVINNCSLYRYISKPWDVTDFNLTVRGALDAYVKSREIETFIYRASHDFRMPITTIKGICNLANIDKQTNKSALDLFGKINFTIISMEKMLEKFMQMHVINAFDLRLTNVNVNQVIEGLAKDFLFELINKNVELEIKIRPEICFYTSGELLKYIIQNILENSISFSKGGKIQLKCQLLGEGLRLKVKDRGCGIPTDQLSKVFDMFYKGGAIKPLKNGNGLGLYVVKKAVERLNGSVEINSEFDKYTIVNVILPMCKDRYEMSLGE